MPMVDWDEKSMKYAICFFPFVGLIIGLAEWIAYKILNILGMGTFLTVCGMTAIPLLITGGIHMDGFIDTADALCSHADKNKKLEIMKDPHIGAFAVIYLCIYILLYAGLLSEITAETVTVFCLGFFLSRALSGIFFTAFKNAKSTGLAAKWSKMTSKKNAVFVMSVEAAVCVVFMFVVNPVSAAFVIAFSAVVSVYHYHNCMKNFGGITGDLAGYFLQLEELAILLACVLGGIL